MHGAGSQLIKGGLDSNASRKCDAAAQMFRDREAGLIGANGA